MNAKTPCIAALLAVFAATACAVDSAPQPDENVDTQSSALGGVGVGGVTGGTGGTGGVQPLPVDPTPDPAPAPPGYAPLGKLVRITTDELDTLLVAALSHSRIVIDTLASSPTVWADYYGCTYPNQEIRDAMIADCMQLPRVSQMACRRQVNIDYPNIKECRSTKAQYHSYVDFGVAAESLGAEDVGLDIQQIYRDSWGPGSVYIDLNYIRTAVDGLHGAHAWFTPEPDYHGAMSFALKLDSNQPTVKLHHTLIPVPDVELTNMVLKATLSGIKPIDGETDKLGFDHAAAEFTFDRNLNNFPDALATTFYDIDALIRSRVESQVKKALEKDGSRASLSKALTELATRKAKERNGSLGVVRFYRAYAESDGTLVVDYEPCPANGCGVAGPGGPIVVK